MDDTIDAVCNAEFIFFHLMQLSHINSIKRTLLFHIRKTLNIYIEQVLKHINPIVTSLRLKCKIIV